MHSTRMKKYMDNIYTHVQCYGTTTRTATGVAIKLAPLSLTILYWTRKHELTLLL